MTKLFSEENETLLLKTDFTIAPCLCKSFIYLEVRFQERFRFTYVTSLCFKTSNLNLNTLNQSKQVRVRKQIGTKDVFKFLLLETERA